MKLILIVLIIAQISGGFSTNIPHRRQHGVTDNWDSSNPIVVSIIQGIDTTIGAVLNAITDAIHNVTLWKGGKLDARLNLLTELKTIQFGLQELVLEITQSILDGTITTQYRQLLSKLIYFLQIHLNNVNDLITILIPTMEDLTATHAITSCLHAGQVIEEAIQKILILFSS